MILLTITMIVGVITVVGLLVTRLPQSLGPRSAAPALPDTITLPAGTSAQAVTFGAGWTAIVTQDNRILIFGADGAMTQEIAIQQAE